MEEEKVLIKTVSCLTDHEVKEWDAELRELEICMYELNLEKEKEKMEREDKIADAMKASYERKTQEREERIIQERKELVEKELDIERRNSLLKVDIKRRNSLLKLDLNVSRRN